MDTLAAYLPQDRYTALGAGQALPDPATGATLFADIAGFTPLTEALTRTLGPRRGVERLTDHINAVYEAIIAAVDRYGGSVISFAGDSITCWFAETPTAPGAAHRAAACALAQQTAMQAFAALAHPAGTGTLALTLKVAVATGPVRRFLVGDPAIQVIEVLAGTTLLRLAAAEHLAAPGEIVLDAGTAQVLTAAEGGSGTEWRTDPTSRERFAVIRDRPAAPPEPPAAPPDPAPALAPEILRAWVAGAVYERLRHGQGDFLTELRPAVSLFLRFPGFDYDADPAAGAQLDAYVRWVQGIVTRYDGTVLSLTIGDKGNYLSAVWGALAAHEDDAHRATAAAQELRHGPAGQAGGDQVQIGLSQGVMRTGAYGSRRRRTYGVMGDEVNLTARLMEAARPGQVLASARVTTAPPRIFPWIPLPALAVKGKHLPVAVYELPVAGAATRHLLEPRPRSTLSGRTAELAYLLGACAAVQTGQGQTVGLTGEPGIGKSRLVREVVHYCEQQGWAVYGGSAQSYGVNIPYLAWRPIWQAFFQIGPATDPATRQARVARIVADLDPTLQERVPLLGPVLDLPFAETALTAGLDEKLRKESREALLVALLRARFAPHPAPPPAGLLVLEDAHWLDPLSRDLLDALGRALTERPVLILLAYRPAESSGTPAIGPTSGPRFSELALGPLAATEIADLLAERLQGLLPGGRPPPAEVVATLTSRVQGNPFYLEELVTYLAEQGIQPQEAAGLATIEWPATLHSLVLSRLDRLAEHQQITLKVASIMGRRFLATWLAGYYPALGALETVQGDLEATTRAELTVPTPPDTSPGYVFRHIVTQEVAYASLAEVTRQTLHAAVGQWWEAAGERDLDLLAFHYSRSHNVAKAREYLRRAAEAAAAAYNNVSAITYYQQLLPLLAAAEQAAVWLALGRVQQLVGNWTAAEDCYQQALAGTEAIPVSAIHPRTHMALGDVLRLKGQHAAAAHHLAQAHALFSRQADRAGLVEATYYTALLHHDQGQFREALAVLHTAPPPTAAREQARAAKLRADVYAAQGEYAAARHHYEEALQLAEAIGDQLAAGRTIGNLGMIDLEQTDFARAQAHFDQWAARATAIGDRLGLCRAVALSGRVHMQQDRLAEAAGCYQQWWQIAAESGNRRDMSYAVGNLGTVYAQWGDFATAFACQVYKLEAALELNDQPSVAVSLANMAEIRWYAHQSTEAAGFSSRAILLARRLEIRYYLAFFLHIGAEIAADQGDLEAAAAWTTESTDLAIALGAKDLQFSARLLALRLAERRGRQSPTDIIAALEALGPTAESAEDQAEIVYRQWSLDPGHDPLRQAAAARYRALYAVVPKGRYRTRYEELTGTSLPTPPLPPVAIPIPTTIPLEQLIHQVDRLIAEAAAPDSQETPGVAR